MKEILIFILFLFISFPVIAQTKTDCAFQPLTGNVRSVETSKISLTQPAETSDQPKEIPWYACRYDPKGNLTERISYDPDDGSIREKLVYNFDENGRNIGYDEYYSNKKQLINVPRKHVYILDDKGRIIEYKVLEADGTSAGRFTYKFDSRGNKIEDGYYYYTGLFGGKTIFTYDANDRETSQISYNSESIINWKNISTYDPQANKVEKLQYRGETLKYKIITTLDDKRRIIEQETIEFNLTGGLRSTHSPVPGKIIYKYDDKKGTTLKETYLPNGNLTSSALTTFDEHGNQIEYFPLNSYGSKTSIKYEYDSHNNWTKRTSVTEEAIYNFYYITERSITYY